MILFKEAAPLSKHISKLRDKGNSIGFAPTMGALHSGHISLIEKSKTICDITVSSIFVNPTQFNDPKDFEKYPVTIGSDISALYLLYQKFTPQESVKLLIMIWEKLNSCLKVDLDQAIFREFAR
jgi:pantoate--beta-alanine ligase